MHADLGNLLDLEIFFLSIGWVLYKEIDLHWRLVQQSVRSVQDGSVTFGVPDKAGIYLMDAIYLLCIFGIGGRDAEPGVHHFLDHGWRCFWRPIPRWPAGEEHGLHTLNKLELRPRARWRRKVYVLAICI